MNVSALQVVISCFSLISLFLYFYCCLVFIGCWFSVLLPGERKEKKKKKRGGGFNMDFLFYFYASWLWFSPVFRCFQGQWRANSTRWLKNKKIKNKKLKKKRGKKNRGKGRRRRRWKLQLYQSDRPISLATVAVSPAGPRLTDPTRGISDWLRFVRDGDIIFYDPTY